MASLTSTALASDCLVTCNRMVFFWLILAIFSTSFSPSCISAISPRRIIIPEGVVIGSLLISSTEPILPIRRMMVCFSLVLAFPVGKSKLDAAIIC